MLAAKNNKSHRDITQGVQIRAVLRMLSDTDLRDVRKATGVGAAYSLESGVSWSRRWEPVPSTRAGFHHGRVAGISDMKSYAEEKARASG